MRHSFNKGVPLDPDAPVRRTACKVGDFILKPENGTFCTMFEGKLYGRMHSSDIYSLLTNREPVPPLAVTNANMAWNPSRGQYSDYCADFCCAQLLHYGMKPPIVKSQAMQMLLAAYGGPDGKTLDVPRSILELEKAMSASWFKIGSEKYDSMDSSSEDNHCQDHNKSLPKHKRASGMSLKRTYSSSFGYQSPERPVRKRSKSPNAQVASLTPKEWVKMFRQQNSKSAMSFSEIRDVIQSLKAKEARQLLGKLLAKSPAAKKNFDRKISFAVKGGVGSQIKSLKANEARDMLATLAGKSSSVESVLSGDLSLIVKGPSGSKPKVVSTSQLAGLYDIEAPSLDSPQGHTFEVYPSSTSSHFWASFDLGVVSGVMRSIRAPPTHSDTDVYFEWRGRESGENVMTFGSFNRAVVTFLPGGLLDGKISVPGHGTLKIYGAMQISDASGSGIARKSASEQLEEVRLCKKIWRGLNEHNYDIESKERWGKWGGNPKDEKAYQSDTTVGKGKRAWKINLQDFMRDPDTDPDEEEDSDENDSYNGDSDEEDSQDDDSEDNSQDEDSEEMSDEQGTDNGEY